MREGGLEVLVSLLAREATSYTDAIIEKDPAFARESGMLGEPPGVPRSRKVSTFVLFFCKLSEKGHWY